MLGEGIIARLHGQDYIDKERTYKLLGQESRGWPFS